MQSIETARYSGTQQELYLICRRAYIAYTGRLPDFTEFKPLYDEGYGAGFFAQILAAEALPANNARAALSEDNRIVLTRAADASLQMWQRLKRYILGAYDEDRALPMLKAAGQAFYADASAYNWQSVKSLANAGSAFLTLKNDDLVANRNMPPNFAESYNAGAVAYDALEEKFFGSVTDGTASTQIKIRANNALYTKLTMILQDGQAIYVNDAVNRQMFVFNNIRSIVSGVSQAGIRGLVTDGATGLPITAATVATANNLQATSTDEVGRFYLVGLAADDYTVTVTADGYMSQTVDVTIKTGTVSTRDVSLSVVAENI